MAITPLPSKLPSQAKKVFSGVVFDVYQWQQEQFDGSMATFEYLKRPDTANMIPITPDHKIILAEQQQPDTKVFLSLAGGGIKTGETIEQAAARELKEETGYQAESFGLLCTIQDIPKIDWAVYTLIARNCQKISDQELEVGEKITVKLVDFEEFLQIVYSKEFFNVDLRNYILNQRLIDPELTLFQKQLFG